MKKAVLRGFVLILSTSLLICGVLSAAVYSVWQTQAKKKELSRIVRVVAEQFDPKENQNEQAKAFAAILSGIRITVIDASGNVTGDSVADYTTMENHASRPEIMQAKGTAVAVSIRASNTVGKRLMYAVIKTNGGFFIRISEEYGSMAAGFVSFLPVVIFSALLSLIIAVYLTNRFTDSVTLPILEMNDCLIGVKDGGVTLKPDEYPYGELRDIAVRINAMAADISMYIERLRNEKNRVAFLLDNINEGFILLDNKQNILLINNSACAYMRCDKSIVGHDISRGTRNYDFLRAVETVLESRQSETIDMKLTGKIIETELIPIDGQEKTSGSVIINMTDVTAERNAAKMRRDFFTNASHELKTPITSIKGCTELLCAGIPLENGQREELLGRVSLETGRMVSLINDIVMINRLESGEITGEKEQVDLAAVVLECCGEVQPLAEQSGVTIHTDLESAQICANRKNIVEMVGNLVMNAVKYNEPNGRVDVVLKNLGSNLVLSVRNDGEPIPAEHQNRVFERFYRVDAGRSKTVGGTGLGLSIVKHAVDTLGGTVQLESREDEGTKITLTIPSIISQAPDIRL